jgi:hypothetical protein
MSVLYWENLENSLHGRIRVDVRYLNIVFEKALVQEVCG